MVNSFNHSTLTRSIWYYQSSSPPWWWPSFLAIAWNTKIAWPRSDTNTLPDPPVLEKDRTVPIIDWPTSTDVAVVFYYPISYHPFTIVHPTHLPQLDPSIKCTFQADYQQEPGYSPTTFIITVFVPIALAWIVLSTLTTHRPIIPLYSLSVCHPYLNNSTYLPEMECYCSRNYSCLDGFKFFTRSDTHTSRVALWTLSSWM
jgi:hypothetical protein